MESLYTHWKSDGGQEFYEFHEISGKIGVCVCVCVCVCIDNCAWEIIVYIDHVFKVICEPKGYCE